MAAAGDKLLRLYGLGGDEADSDMLYQASCRALELDAMARTLSLRVQELQAIENPDADVRDDILKLSAQQYEFREIASQLRCTRSKSALTAAFGAAAMAQAMFGLAKNTAENARKDGEYDHTAAVKAVATAKASYGISFFEIRSRAQYRIEEVLRVSRDSQYDQYTGFPIHRFMKDPSTTHVLKNFKTTLDEMDTLSLTSSQQKQIDELHVTLNTARINAFNITDTKVDEQAIHVAATALGDDFAGQFDDYADSGQTVEDFLAQARMQRGFAPVEQRDINEYTSQITKLTLKKESSGLSEIEQADLDCYKAAYLRAQAVNAFFESQRELKAATTLRAQMELVIVQDNLMNLEGLPLEAAQVHLEEAKKRLEKLKVGTAITEEDVASAVLRVRERLDNPDLEASIQAPSNPLVLSEAVMEEVKEAAKEAAKGICICNPKVAMYPFPLSRHSNPALELV